jgi:hypothetical protein
MGVEIGEKLPFSPRPPRRSPEWTARVSKRLCSPMVTYSKALLLRRLVSTLRASPSLSALPFGSCPVTFRDEYSGQTFDWRGGAASRSSC